MIVQVMLVYGIYYMLGVGRYRAVKSGAAKVEQFRANNKEPAASLIVRNNLENQFELPTLFHTVCLALYVTGNATLYPVLLAWLFVASRLGHAWIHLTTNRIRHRQPLFTSGYLIHGLLWLWLAVNIAIN